MLRELGSRLTASAIGFTVTRLLLLLVVIVVVVLVLGLSTATRLGIAPVLRGGCEFDSSKTRASARSAIARRFRGFSACDMRRKMLVRVFLDRAI